MSWLDDDAAHDALQDVLLDEWNGKLVVENLGGLVRYRTRQIAARERVRYQRDGEALAAFDRHHSTDALPSILLPKGKLHGAAYRAHLTAQARERRHRARAQQLEAQRGHDHAGRT